MDGHALIFPAVVILSSPISSVTFALTTVLSGGGD
jgi:hypothetical protein